MSALSAAPKPETLPRLPRHAPGMRIGLFGGSFNPAHRGHLLVSQTALRRLKLDRIWWLVTPGNPLKDTSGLPGLAERMAAARRLASDPRVDITGFEAQIGTRFSFDTISYLKKRCPSVHFVWVMGADNLVGFHRWQHWQDIARAMPIAIVDRPGATLRATASIAARRFARYRIDESAAADLAKRAPPAWIFLHGRRSTLSSTQLRKETPTVVKLPQQPG